MFALIRLPSAVILWIFTFTLFTGHLQGKAGPVPGKPYRAAAVEKYRSWQLSASGLSEKAFLLAMAGYEKLQQRGMLENTEVMTIIDFSKPSSEKRLFIIDLQTGTLLFKTLVAHGRNSGREQARRFSNKRSSFASSPGFYVTGSTYEGKHGYSLRLQGCERGWNERAMERAIVVHGADYVSEAFLQQNGYLGRSHGCPAIPVELSKAIIDTIRDGSCLFIYAPVNSYLKRSALLN